MGDGMSDSDSVREARTEERLRIAEERQRNREKTEKVKTLARQIDSLDREITEHDKQINGKRIERDRLQQELECIISGRNVSGLSF